MDLMPQLARCKNFLKKYRYAAVILLIGLILMTLPDRKQTTEEIVQETNNTNSNEINICEQLEDVLSQIDGAGKVCVMLTIRAGEEIIYQSDGSTSIADSNSTTQNKTVVITSADKNQTGLIRQLIPPKYLGAIVVCEGADSPSVQYAIVDAVAKVTGLGSDHISVLKMK